MMFRTFVRPLLVALSLAFAVTAAAPAFADDGTAKAADHKKGDHKGKGKGKHSKKPRLELPTTAEKFTKVVDESLVKAKEKLGAGLTKHKVAEADKTKVLKEFDDGAALVRAAAKRVGKDGSVTKEEAKEVRTLTKSLRKQMRAKYATKADKPVAKPAAPKDI